MADSTLSVLEKALDLRMQAHAVHSSNIANANVPGFKAKKIDFEEKLNEAVTSLEKNTPLISKENEASANVENIKADVYEDPYAKLGPDGNTVIREKEMTELSKNYLEYQSAIQMLNKKLAMAKLVLGEGGRP